MAEITGRYAYLQSNFLRIIIMFFYVTGGEDTTAVSQTLDYSGGAAYDDSTSVTSSNVHMELLSSKHSRSTPNISENSDNDSSKNSVKKEKKKKEKVGNINVFKGLKVEK